MKLEKRRHNKVATQPELKLIEILRAAGYLIELPQALHDMLPSDPDGGIKFQYPVLGYICDFVDVTKTIINVNGDFWHVNPAMYDVNDTASLYPVQVHNLKKDAARKKFLLGRGYTILDFWQSTINEQPQLVLQEVQLTLLPLLTKVEDWSVFVKKLVKEDILVTLKRLNLATVKDVATTSFGWDIMLSRLHIEKRGTTAKAAKDFFTALGIVPARKCKPKIKKPKLPRKSKMPVTVEELRILVWEKSLLRLSKELKLSDNGIRKFCKNHKIPLPPYGFWRRKEVGYSTEESTKSHKRLPVTDATRKLRKHLTPEQVAEVKRLNALGKSNADIAKITNISIYTVTKITGGRCYK